MDDKKLAEELAKNVNEIMEQEAKQDLNINEENVYEVIESRKNEYDYLNKVGLNNFEDRRKEEIDEITKRDDLSFGEKGEELRKINEYYSDISKRMYDQNSKSEKINSRISDIMEIKEELLQNRIIEFDISHELLSDIEKYNNGANTLSQISNININEIDINGYKEDIDTYFKFCEETKIENLKYDNIKDQINNINILYSKYPKGKALVSSSKEFVNNSNKLISAKEKELKLYKKNMFISTEESKIYFKVPNPQEFCRMSMEKDYESTKLTAQLKEIRKDINFKINQLKTIDSESEEYNTLKNQIDQNKIEEKNIDSILSNKRQMYIDRCVDLNKKYKQYEKDVKDLEDTKQKLDELNIKAMSVNNLSKNGKINDVNLDDVDELADNKTPKSDKETQTKSEGESNSNETKSKNVNKPIVQGNQQNVGSGNNIASNAVNTNAPVNSNVKNANDNNKRENSEENYIDRILKMSGNEFDQLINNEGYSDLIDTLSLIKKDKNLKLPKDKRRNIADAIKRNMENSLDNEEISNKKNEITTLMDKLGTELPELDSDELFNALYMYDEQENSLPCIAQGIIRKNDRKSVAFMIEKYGELLKNNELTEDEMNTFEKYILNPVSASVVNKDLESMNTLNRIKAKISGNKVDSYKLIKVAMSDLNDVKKEIKLKENSKSNKDVYDPDEAARNQQERESKENNRKNKTQENPVR